MTGYSSPSPRRDPALYERLTSRGIAEADAHGSCIDLTARRLAIWLVPRAQDDTELMRGLIRFARTGAITHALRERLRHHARTSLSPNGPHAVRLLQYAVARGADHGPIGPDFAAACDQIDRADAMLEDLHDRVSNSRCAPKEAARRVSEPPNAGKISLAKAAPVSRPSPRIAVGDTLQNWLFGMSSDTKHIDALAPFLVGARLRSCSGYPRVRDCSWF